MLGSLNTGVTASMILPETAFYACFLPNLYMLQAKAFSSPCFTLQ